MPETVVMLLALVRCQADTFVTGAVDHMRHDVQRIVGAGVYMPGRCLTGCRPSRTRIEIRRRTTGGWAWGGDAGRRRVAARKASNRGRMTSYHMNCIASMGDPYEDHH